jgi:membrane-bound inhibitor of C-type lysozyme
MLLICAGCATAPNGNVPINSSAPTVTLPSSTRVLGEGTVYISATGERVQVVHDDSAGIAIVKLPDGGMAVLPLEIADSAGRYRDNHMIVWEKGGVVLLWIDGKLVFNGKEAN